MTSGPKFVLRMDRWTMPFTDLVYFYNIRNQNDLTISRKTFSFALAVLCFFLDTITISKSSSRNWDLKKRLQILFIILLKKMREFQRNLNEKFFFFFHDALVDWMKIFFTFESMVKFQILFSRTTEKFSKSFGDINVQIKSIT